MSIEKEKWHEPLIKDYMLDLKDTEKHESTAESLFPVADQPFHGNDS